MYLKEETSAVPSFARRIAQTAGTLLRGAAAGVRKAAAVGYRVCYVTGIEVLRIGRAIGRRAARILAPAGRVAYRFIDWALLRPLRAFAGECRRIGQGFAIAGRRVSAAFRRHPALALLQILLLPFLAVRRHRKMVVSLLNIAAPAAAAFLMVFTLHYWSGVEFGLVVEYGGEKLGYIADESVFDTAATMAAERVINTDDSFQVERVPKLTLAMVRSDLLLDESAVCDRILSSASDSITEASGLYVDGRFIGAVESRAALDGLLGGILDSHRDGSGTDQAQFLQDVKVVDGLYPLTSTISADAMRTHLTAQTVVEKRYAAEPGDSYNRIAGKHGMTVSELKALNPDQGDMIHIGDELVVQRPQTFLQVQVTRVVEYEKTLDYQTKKVQDSSQYEGYQKVQTQGKEGLQRITAEVTYVDGVEQSRNILSTETIREPVDKVVVVGGKKVNPNAYTGDGISTGKFMWPLPYTRNITSPFGRRGRSTHSGIDICSAGVYGQSIVAADGGVVVKTNTSGWGMSYGSYVLIDHGGGYQTMYAHCSSVLVKPGQKVTKGQVIAKVGNTGRSTGAHLHFEIRINGKATNPLAFVG